MLFLLFLLLQGKNKDVERLDLLYKDWMKDEIYKLIDEVVMKCKDKGTVGTKINPEKFKKKLLISGTVRHSGYIITLSRN